MVVAMLLSLAIGMTLVQRGWIPKLRAAGVPPTKTTRAQWLLSLAMLASLAAAIVAEEYVYRLTQNRIAEAAVAICAILPVGFILIPESFLRLRPVTASESQVNRFNYFAQFFVYVPMALNLMLQFTERNRDRSVANLQDWNIAIYFAILTLAPFSVDIARRRYLEAKALKEIGPPDRWQAYKERLARNE
jgi:hypothetical protein